MPFPSDVGLVTVTGTFIDFEGAPIIGAIRFDAKVPVLLAVESDVVLVPISREVTLDADGKFVVHLPPTDDERLQPDYGWTYEVTELWPNGRKYPIEVPSGHPTPWDITDLSPVSVSKTDIVRGNPGPPGRAGDPGPSAQSGYFGPPTYANDAFSVPIISGWGVRDDGTAYYDPEGAPESEAAILGFNSLGQLMLRRLDGEADPTVTGDVFDAVSDAAMVALTYAKKGDRVRRLDQSRMYQLKGDDPTDIGSWVADLVPAPEAQTAGSSAVVSNTLVQRDIAGNFEVNTPTATVHPASKLYVDSSRRLTGAGSASTTYTLDPADEGKLVPLSNSAAVTVTIPPNSVVPFPLGTVIELLQTGAGRVTVAPGTGVTLSAPDDSYSLRARYSRARLIKIGTDAWMLEGDLNTAMSSFLTPGVITSVTRPASPVIGRRYKETDTGDVVLHDGTRWVKVGGAPRLIIDAGNGVASGFISATGSYIGLLTYNTPNHTAGLLRVKWSGVMFSGTNAAALMAVSYAGVTLPGSVSRIHNHANAVPVTFLCQSTAVSDGSIQSLTILAAVDQNGGQMQMLENSCSLWLEALPQ